MNTGGHTASSCAAAWTTLVLATFLACAGAGAVGAEPPAAQPTPFKTPLYWGDLPPPTAPVHLKTPIGEFTLPMDYLTGWFALKDQPLTTAPDGARQFSDVLSFSFEYPGGGMSSNPEWIEAIRDAKGAIVPGRTTVFVMSAKPPDPSRTHEEIDALATEPPGSLVRNPTYSRDDHEVLGGVVASPGAGHRIGVSLNCRVNCLFDFYLEDQGIVLDGVMDGAFRHDGLAIAEQAQALFKQWKLPAPGAP